MGVHRGMVDPIPLASSSLTWWRLECRGAQAALPLGPLRIPGDHQLPRMAQMAVSMQGCQEGAESPAGQRHLWGEGAREVCGVTLSPRPQ